MMSLVIVLWFIAIHRYWFCLGLVAVGIFILMLQKCRG